MNQKILILPLLGFVLIFIGTYTLYLNNFELLVYNATVVSTNMQGSQCINPSNPHGSLIPCTIEHINTVYILNGTPHNATVTPFTLLGLIQIPQYSNGSTVQLLIGTKGGQTYTYQNRTIFQPGSIQLDQGIVDDIPSIGFIVLGIIFIVGAFLFSKLIWSPSRK